MEGFWDSGILGFWDSGILGFSGAHVYERNNVNGILKYDRKRYDGNAQILPNLGKANLVAMIAADDSHYIPESPQLVKTFIEAGYGKNGQPDDPFPLSIEWKIPELSDFHLRSEPEPLWNRAAFVADLGIFIALPPERDAVTLYHSDISSVIAREEASDALTLGNLPYLVNRNENLVHEFKTFKNVASVELLDAPPGAKLSPEGVLTWKVDPFIESPVKFEIEAVSQYGESVVKNVSLEINGESGAYAVAYTETERIDDKKLPLGHSVLALPKPAKELFPAGGGRYLGAIFSDPPMVNLYNIETRELKVSLGLESDPTTVVANAHSIYLYSKEKTVIERVSIDKPEERISIAAPGQIIGLGTGWAADREPLVVLERLPSKLVASETASIGNRTFTIERSQSGGHAMELLDPLRLERSSSVHTPEIADIVNKSISYSWSECKAMATSPNGQFVFFGKAILSFPSPEKWQLDPVGGQIPFSDNIRFVSDDGAHFFQRGKCYEKGSELLSFSIEGEGVPVGDKDWFLAFRRRENEVSFYQYGNEKPTFLVKNMEENDTSYSASRATSPIPEHQLIHYFPRIKKLVSTSLDGGYLYIRDLDLDTIRTKLR